MSDYESRYYETLSELDTATSELTEYKKAEAQLRKELAKDRHYFLTEISRLHSVLAEREAEIAKLREALEEFPTSFHILPKNESCKCSQCNALRIKQEALSTPPSTSYLNQWEKEHYQVVARVSIDNDAKLTFDLIDCELPSGTTLYARKEK